ncbi:PREDICTED: adhesion G-protein coupled receptor G2-like isoform X1 [Acropora digitifera]|uniref:adhesion G-protein coupled receptor G2-like isoform X1 n=1 Tax=Acropora digitifera TaxID=70779 RepID=UPI000779F1C1|nr:PREDICTED: adhesion G-protein coupled receptor G2-like isoform X1 [Acropora digitifera]
MEYVHRPVAPTVSAFLVVLYGIGTLEPARVQFSYPHVDDSQSFNARSFLLNSTRWNCTPSVAAVDGEPERDWNEQLSIFFSRNFRSGSELMKFSCRNRCGSDERNAETIKKFCSRNPVPCFCDKLCVEFGDCCFDFSRRCRHLANPRGHIPSSNQICRHGKPLRYPGESCEETMGYAVWTTCPKNWSDPIVQHKCQNEDQSDFLNNLPVFDNDSRITYRNIFCARCNGAVNTRYWKLGAICWRWFNTTGLPIEDLMRMVDAKCKVIIIESWLRYLKRCIPRFQDCSTVSQEKNDMNCQSQCLGYAFPVYARKSKTVFRNVQCALCSGFKPMHLTIFNPEWASRTVPPLSILFDFTFSSESSINIIDREMNASRYVQQSWSCDPNEVYDPYTAQCNKIVCSNRTKASTGTQFVKTGLRTSENVAENKTKLHSNCTFIGFNESDYVEPYNDTVHVKPHHKVYRNASCKIIDNKLFLCVKFSRNATVFGATKQRSVGYIKPLTAPLQIMTSVGCIASMVSLILLLTTYTFFSELRNLPGRIIINLSLSLLFYQGVFLGAVKTGSNEQCKVIAILLHFFVLCSFTWMNVMAYDMHKTFTSSVGGRGSSHQLQHTRRFVRYCIYGWGAPAIVVSTFVIIDQLISKGFVGYGQDEAYCFIADRKAILYFFVVPVALILVFNLFALVHTVLHIVKTRKRTHRETNQQHNTCAALICVKMASVMGVTWILGIAANVHALSFLWYPYTVLNSLQGVFIFLSFAASGRSLELYRAKISILRNRCFQKAPTNKERSKNIAKPSSQKPPTLGSRNYKETRV